MLGMRQDGDDFQPDAIITCGLPPMDKKWRAQLVEWKAPHWHIGNEVHDWDMFNAKVGSWNISAARGLAQLVQAMPGFNAHAGQWNVAADRRAASVAKMAAEWPRPMDRLAHLPPARGWHWMIKLRCILPILPRRAMPNGSIGGDRALHANRGAGRH